MSRRSRRDARDVELMGTGIVGTFLSREPQSDVYGTPGDAEAILGRFIHDQEDICNLRLLGTGKHGVVFRARIKNFEYALKVVSAARRQSCLL